MKQRWFFLLAALLLGVACALPGLSGVPSPTAAPTTVKAEQATAAPSPSPKEEGACLLTAKQEVEVYARPHADAVRLGILNAGGSLQPVYRTADGWYGFDPGLEQAEKVGIFRLVWVQGTAFKQTGACEALPLAPPLPAGVCFAVAREAVDVRAEPKSGASVVGTLQPKEYAAAQAQGQDGWLQVNLDSGQNALSGTGWVLASKVALDGPCQGLPQAAAANAPTAAPQPPPTATAMVIPTLGPEQRILFAPGAVRWSRVLSDRENAFVFKAAEGQSAMISLTGVDTPPPLALTDPSGKPLQTFQDGYSEWRGLLLATGDYHIGLAIPQGMSGLELEVAIYPLPAEPQRVVNTDAGYSLVYDQTVFQPGEPLGKNAFLTLRLTSPQFDHTNLLGAYITLDNAPPDDPDHCLNTPPDVGKGGEEPEAIRINGVTYMTFAGSEGAAGSRYYRKVFRAAVHGRCLSVRVDVRDYDLENETDSSISEYDAQAVWDELWRVLLTLRWLQRK